MRNHIKPDVDDSVDWAKIPHRGVDVKIPASVFNKEQQIQFARTHKGRDLEEILKNTAFEEVVDELNKNK